MEKGAGGVDKSEPKLVPGWLKTANGGGGGAATSSLVHSDELGGGGRLSRSRLLVSTGNNNGPQASSRSSSSSWRSTSSNGSMNQGKDDSPRMYSSFGGSHRNRDRHKDFDIRDRNRSFLFDSLDSLITSKNVKETSKQSQSMVSGKQGESGLRKAGHDPTNRGIPGSTVIGGLTNILLERDFPTLGAEERQGSPEIVRVASPRPLNAVQSLSFGGPTIFGGDGWASALAEVPPGVGGNGPVLPSSLQGPTATPASSGLNIAMGMNMAETLAQAPSCVHTDTQSSSDSQRIEELKRRQCAKLIPMTPSLPKSSALNSSEKSKIKGARGDFVAPSKIMPQSSSQPVNHTLRTPARSDISKPSQAGNLLVLNREKNGIAPNNKDGQSPTSVSRVANPLTVDLSAAASPLKNSVEAKMKSDGKGHLLSPTQSSFGEKKPISQAKNRNDFFNSLRKKTTINHLNEASPPSSSSSNEKSGDQIIGFTQQNVSSTTSGLECVEENGVYVTGFDGPHEEAESSSSDNGENMSFSDHVDDPEEKAFLELLGWKSGDGGEDFLTAEEVTDFIEENYKRMPSSKLSQLQQIVVNDFGVPSFISGKEPSEKEEFFC